MVPQVTASHFIPTKILVPVDFSSSSDAALETASDLAQHWHSARTATARNWKVGLGLR